MAITEKNIKDISSGMRSAYQKAVDVLDKHQFEYGIDLLKPIVQKEPGFLDARSMLRSAERQKTEMMSSFQKMINSVKAFRFILKAQTLVSKKPVEALSVAEEALALNLYLPAALNLLATAAKNADAKFICSEALQILVDIDPKNEANLRAAAALYKSIGEGKSLLLILQRLSAIHPDSLELKGQVREAAALATMEEGQWEKQKSAAQKAKEVKKNQKDGGADIGDKIIRAKDDVLEAITQMEKAIAGGNDSVSSRRMLGELYFRADEFEKSTECYEWIAKKMGTLDPAIDRAIEKNEIALSARKTDALRAKGASEEEINAEATRLLQYRLERGEARVKSYPNDLLCRFELAEVYWDAKEIDKALEQFQIAQRNPAKRLLAIVYLGRCFHAKGQNDMAVEQFRKALEEMPVMDADKKFTLYHLGVTYDETGDPENALECFKQIYSADVNYQDVGERMNAYYERKKQQSAQ